MSCPSAHFRRDEIFRLQFFRHRFVSFKINDLCDHTCKSLIRKETKRTVRVANVLILLRDDPESHPADLRFETQ